jgi:hypothetical protein
VPFTKSVTHRTSLTMSIAVSTPMDGLSTVDLAIILSLTRAATSQPVSVRPFIRLSKSSASLSSLHWCCRLACRVRCRTGLFVIYPVTLSGETRSSADSCCVHMLNTDRSTYRSDNQNVTVVFNSECLVPAERIWTYKHTANDECVI